MRRPDILLVVPNQRWGGTAYWSLQPYGLANLVATLAAAGRQAAVLDANLEDLDVADAVARILAARPACAGISVLAATHAPGGHLLAAALKRVAPALPVILGGVYATTRPERVLADPAVDCAVLGEGEAVLPQLLDALLDGAPQPATGVARRGTGGRPVVPERVLVPDLAALPPPAFAAVGFGRYLHEFRRTVDAPRALPYARLLTSRGCPQGCSFCQVAAIAGRRTRFQPAVRVLAEIGELRRLYGLRAVEFADDNFLGDRARVEELCRGLEGQELVWNVMNASPRQLDADLLARMRRAGCAYVALAVESAVPRVQRECVGKTVDLEQARRLVSTARELGIDTTALFVFGFPGETRAEIAATVDFAASLGADYVKLNVATALPGTPLHAAATAGGTLDPAFDVDAYEWGRAGISTTAFSAAELTALRAREWERINFATPEKTRKIAAMMRCSEADLAAVRRETARAVSGA